MYVREYHVMYVCAGPRTTFNVNIVDKAITTFVHVSTVLICNDTYSCIIKVENIKDIPTS